MNTKNDELVISNASDHYRFVDNDDGSQKDSLMHSALADMNMTPNNIPDDSFDMHLMAEPKRQPQKEPDTAATFGKKQNGSPAKYVSNEDTFGSFDEKDDGQGPVYAQFQALMKTMQNRNV